MFQWVREAEARVEQVEINFERDSIPEHCDLLPHAQADLNSTLAIKEGFWKQNVSSC